MRTVGIIVGGAALFIGSVDAFSAFGPVVLAGDADSSVLVQLIEGRADPSLKMPHGDEPLYQGEIETIRLWVSQGAADN